jgi:hypothetical protein
VELEASDLDGDKPLVQVSLDRTDGAFPSASEDLGSSTSRTIFTIAQPFAVAVNEGRAGVVGFVL